MDDMPALEAAVAALQAQRALLGNAVVDMAVAPLLQRLQALREAQAALAAAPAPLQQLKQVSVLFVDAVGSTAMGQQLEPEDIQTIMDGALLRFSALVNGRGGRVLQYTGDGLLAAFGADESREDDAEQAVRAGLAILQAAQQHAQQVEAEQGVPGFGVRVGIHTGPVLLGGGVDAEGSIRGAAVNIAARMEQTAPPGTLRISATTQALVRGLFRLHVQPVIEVKGSAQPLLTYLVQGALPPAFRMRNRGVDGLDTPMVAREAELEQLQNLFHRLCADARLGAGLVVAEAGIGKSRLLYEFERWLHEQAAEPALCHLVLRGRAQPHNQQQPYGLLRDLLAWHLQIADSDDAATARLKLDQALSPLLGDDGQAQAHLLGQLIGLDFSASPHVRGILDDARQIRNRGFHALAQLLSPAPGALTELPIVLLLDDLHWADEGSLDFISYLMQVNRDKALLLLCMTRPTLFERRPQWASLEWLYQRIELAPLDKRGSRELANLLLQRLDKVPAALRELIIGGAEGNPFYMEELLRMLIDSGAILTDGPRWQVVADKLLSVQVPPTLTGVLQARVDGLSTLEKPALQQASVIGYVFWDQTLGALDAQSPQALAPLVQRGLVVPQPQASLAGMKEYTFCHQILHQVTYDGLLKREKRAYHARAAAWLAQQGGDRAAETLGLAAEHFDRAGDQANACAYFSRAAEDAAARYANGAMLAYVARALALVDPADLATRWRLLALREAHLLFQDDRAAHAADLQALAGLAQALADDDKHADLALRQAALLQSQADHGAAEKLLRQALQRVRDVSAPRHEVSLLRSLSAALTGQGQYAAAREVCDHGLRIARLRGERANESRLINAMGLIAMEQGELSAAAEYFEQGLAMAREDGNRASEALRLNNLGSVYPRLGDYAQARRHLADGLKLARALGRRDAEAAVLLNTASVAHLQGDDASALAYAQHAFDASAASGQRDLEAYARLVVGHAELGLGRLDEARAAYADSADRLRQLDLRAQQVLDPLSGLVRVALARGQPGLALAELDSILAHLQQGGSLDGTEEPLLIPLSCHQALAALSDPRADAVLASAHAELMAQAGRILDGAARQRFLQAVPHHRALVAAWAARDRA